MKKIILNQLTTFFSLLFIILPTTSLATVFTLYDATQNNSPEDQAWLSYFSDGSATPDPVSGGVNLKTATNERAGFTNYFKFPPSPFPTLDSSAGFTLSFSMQLNAEDHTLKNTRSGFSVILLDKNNLGVELGFWTDYIWSQSSSPLFDAKDEQTTFNTAAGPISYDLTFLNSSYYLTQNNSVLLSGGLKDYSAFGMPYSLNNFLFLGDDTTSASADVNLGEISLSDKALYNPVAVPTPSSITLIFIGLLGLIRFHPISKGRS